MDSRSRPTTALEWTTQTLREELLSGNHAPGQPLKQDEIAERLGISRMPVREAIRTLAAEGLVIERPNRMAIVAPLEASDARELFEIRAELECLAARRSLSVLTEAQIAEIVRRHAALAGAGEADYPALHLDFHRVLYAGAGPRLRALVDHHVLLAERYLRYERRHLAVTEEDRDEHAALCEAAAARDAERAVAVLHPHIAEGGQAIAAALEERELLR